jgi:hypothetical protein
MQQPNPAQIPDIHFVFEYPEMQNQIMVKVTIRDNYGLAFSTTLPAPLVRQLGGAMKDAADQADQKLVTGKPNLA